MGADALRELMACDDQGEAGKLPAFAWPGGYAMFYVTAGGDQLCATCATVDLTCVPAHDDPPVLYGAYGATEDYPEYFDATCDNCHHVIAEGSGK